MFTVQPSSNTSSLYIFLPSRYGLKYLFTICSCNIPVLIVVAQGCKDYETIIEAFEPTYKSLEEHSDSITGVWINRSHTEASKHSSDPFCSVDWNASKL